MNIIKNLINLFKVKTIIMSNEENLGTELVEHVLNEQDFAKSPTLADNGFKVGDKVKIPETGIVDGVVTLTEADFAEQKKAEEKVQEEAAEGARQAGEENVVETMQREAEEKEKLAAEKAAEIKAEAGENVETTEESGEIPTVDKIDEYFAHPRKRELARIVVANEAGKIEDFESALKEASFELTQAAEIKDELLEAKILDGGAPKTCANC